MSGIKAMGKICEIDTRTVNAAKKALESSGGKSAFKTFADALSAITPPQKITPADIDLLPNTYKDYKNALNGLKGKTMKIGEFKETQNKIIEKVLTKKIDYNA